MSKISSAKTTSGKLGKASTILLNPSKAFARYDNLFLISHMRARTSVLSHVLGSHPSIAGYYEQHISHEKKLSGLRLRASLLQEGLVPSSTRYLFDKTLHAHLDPPPAAPSSKIFLLRRPVSTVSSIIAMGQKRDTKWQNQDEAFSYYTDRLQSLSQQAQNSRDRFVLLKSEEIVSRTDEVLGFLTKFLSLDVPLTSSYEGFEKTGRAFSGDPSQTIRAGKIVKSEGNRNVELDPESLAKADEVYADVLAEFTNMSNVVVP